MPTAIENKDEKFRQGCTKQGFCFESPTPQRFKEEWEN